MVGVQDPHHVLRLARLREGGETPQVAEDDRDLAAVAVEQRLVARRDDQVDELRSQKALQPADLCQLLDLLTDALLELPVPALELRGLGLDRVVIALDAQQRSDPRDQLGLIEGLRDEVVGTRLDRGQLLLVAARGDHHHGQQGRGRVGPQPPADLVAVHPRHDDVEQYEVGQLGGDLPERLLARARGYHLVAARFQRCLEELHVLRRVVDDGDLRGGRHGKASRRASSSPRTC